MNEREQEILRQAQGALEIATKAQVEIDPIGWEFPPEPPETKIDARLKIKLAGKELTYLVGVNAAITPTVMGILINQPNAFNMKWLLVAQYIPLRYAKILREMEIPFLDTAGNAYINEPPIHIDIQGKRPEGMEWPKLAEKGILRQAGLRVVYVLICRNELINATYREIAKTADTALGTVDRVFKDLQKRNFITIIGNRKRQFTRKRELIDWWVTEYADKLRPRLIIGRYETDDYENLQQANLEKLGAQWGGEMAGEKMTHYLRPEVFTIYARRPVNDLILQLKLRDRPTGKIEIRERFWNFEDKRRSKKIVHPVLIYADLLATGDPRNIEAAKKIYDVIIATEN